MPRLDHTLVAGEPAGCHQAGTRVGIAAVCDGATTVVILPLSTAASRLGDGFIAAVEADGRCALRALAMAVRQRTPIEPACTRMAHSIQQE